jgi:hypothetical protein
VQNDVVWIMRCLSLLCVDYVSFLIVLMHGLCVVLFMMMYHL